MTRTNIVAGVVCAVALAACDRPAPQGNPAPTTAPPPMPQAVLETRLEQARRELDREFVVFATPKLIIDRLGAPVPAPVTVGSSPRPATMMSDDPEVVMVTPEGALVAHREGSARVRAAGSSSTLTVIVRTRGRVADSRRAGSETRKGVSP